MFCETVVLFKGYPISIIWLATTIPAHPTCSCHTLKGVQSEQSDVQCLPQQHCNPKPGLMLWKSLITVIYPTWNSYKMQSWPGTISDYYPWSVSCKTYTLWRCRGPSVATFCAACGSQPLGYSTTLSPSFTLLLISRTHGLCCKRGSALSCRQICFCSSSQPSYKGNSLDSYKMQTCIPGWQKKLTQTSHTSNECSKLYTAPALSSGILKINFTTFSKEDLQGTCHKRLGPGSRF